MGKYGRGQPGSECPGVGAYLTHALVHSREDNGAVVVTGTGVAGVVEPSSACWLEVLGFLVWERRQTLHTATESTPAKTALPRGSTPTFRFV